MNDGQVQSEQRTRASMFQLPFSGVQSCEANAEGPAHGELDWNPADPERPSSQDESRRTRVRRDGVLHHSQQIQPEQDLSSAHSAQIPSGQRTDRLLTSSSSHAA